MKNTVPRIAALERAFTMLDRVIADGGSGRVSALARAAGMPVSTAHRQVATLADAGYLLAIGRGRHVAGPRLLNLLNRIDEKHVVASVAAPLFPNLATELGAIVQLGTFEGDMITYRLKAGRGARRLFTRTGMQLEAYCSAIGKVMLADLPAMARLAYLAGGPFVPLTARTMTDPAMLAVELDRVAASGHATDLGEVADGLACLAVPIRRPDGSVVASISASRATDVRNPAVDPALLPPLCDAAARIADAVFGPLSNGTATTSHPGA